MSSRAYRCGPAVCGRCMCDVRVSSRVLTRCPAVVALPGVGGAREEAGRPCSDAKAARSRLRGHLLCAPPRSLKGERAPGSARVWARRRVWAFSGRGRRVGRAGERRGRRRRLRCGRCLRLRLGLVLAPAAKRERAPRRVARVCPTVGRRGRRIGRAVGGRSLRCRPRCLCRRGLRQPLELDRRARSHARPRGGARPRPLEGARARGRAARAGAVGWCRGRRLRGRRLRGRGLRRAVRGLRRLRWLCWLRGLGWLGRLS